MRKNREIVKIQKSKEEFRRQGVRNIFFVYTAIILLILFGLGYFLYHLYDILSKILSKSPSL
jgi:hypothetical protein